MFKKPKDKHSACGNWRNKKKPGQSTTAYVPKGSPASRDKKSCGRCGKTLRKRNVQHLENVVTGVMERIITKNAADQKMNVDYHEDDEDCHSTDDENYFLEQLPENPRGKMKPTRP